MCSAGDLFTAELPQPGEAATHWHCHSGSEDNLRHLRGEADLGFRIKSFVASFFFHLEKVLKLQRTLLYNKNILS